MGFWIFMAIASMMTPLLMIVMGYWFVKHPPRTINDTYGYRTAMSRKNQQTWDFAHFCCGKVWWKTGWCMGILTLPVMLVVRGGGEDTVGGILGLWVFLQGMAMILTIPVVERALRKKFPPVRLQSNNLSVCHLWQYRQAVSLATHFQMSKTRMRKQTQECLSTVLRIRKSGWMLFESSNRTGGNYL